MEPDSSSSDAKQRGDYATAITIADLQVPDDEPTSSTIYANASTDAGTPTASSAEATIAASAQQQKQDTIKKTPLPFGKVFVLCVILFCEAFNITSLFPYVGFMVKDFGLVESEKEAGYYAGLIASCFSLGQFTSGFFWGWLSDRKSKKLVMMIGLLANCFTMMAFGFSRSFLMSLATRTIAGLMNGNTAAAKSCLGDITDSTNQARGFSLIGLTWGLGTVVGPAVGGLLARPVQKYPSVFSSTGFFATFPYVLPCIVSAAASLIGFLCGFFFLEDIRDGKKSDTTATTTTTTIDATDSADADADAKKEKVNREEETELKEIVQQQQEKQPEDNEDNNDNDDTVGLKEHDQLQEQQQDAELGKSSHSFVGLAGRKAKKTIWTAASQYLDIARNRQVSTVVAIYFFVSMSWVIFDECMPLWAMKSVEDGGLDFDSSKIGTWQVIQGASLFLIQLFFFHRLSDRFGPLRLLRFGLLSSAPFFLFFSLQYLCLKLVSGTSGTVLLWVLMSITAVIRAGVSICCFTPSFMLTNNCCPRERIGLVNGAAQSMAALARAIGPWLGGWIFAWSSQFTLPLHANQMLAFGAGGTMLLLDFALSLRLSKSIDKPQGVRSFI